MVPCLVVPVLEASCAQVIQPPPLGGEFGLGAFGAGNQIAIGGGDRHIVRERRLDRFEIGGAQRDAGLLLLISLGFYGVQRS